MKIVQILDEIDKTSKIQNLAVESRNISSSSILPMRVEK